MTQTQQTTASPLDAHRSLIEGYWNAGLSYAHIVATLRSKNIPTSDRSLRRAIRRWDITPRSKLQEGPEKPGLSVNGDTAQVTGKATTELTDYETLLRSRGLDPEEWEVTHLTVNEWDSPTGDTLRQLKVTVRRLRPLRLVLPASDGPSYRVVRRGKRGGYGDEGELVVFVGDHQAPYVNQHLLDCFCQFAERNRPERGCFMGDTVDFPDISRHPENPEWHVKAQECVNSGYLILRDSVQACEDTEWVLLMGNHDERIRARLLNYLTNLYDLRPAQIPGQPEEIPAWDLRRLLHLESLGIQLIEPNGSYTHAQWTVSPYLAARHGHIARKGSGASALGTLEEFGFSMVIGHTHRQSLIHKTTHDINGQTTTVAGVETGCMCRIEEGLGYTPAPDWQNGFATATVWPDGTFKVDLATYVNNTLYWRDQRFS